MPIASHKYLKMKLSIIKILLWTSGALAAILIVLLLIVHLQHDRIKNTITQTINDQIESRFSYSDFELSLISTFPFVRARMTDVYLTGKDRLPFIHAGNLDLKLDLRALMRSEIHFRNIQLNSGTVYLIESEDNSFNYQVFKGGSEEGDGAINLILRNIDLTDMILVIDLKNRKQRYRTYIPNLKVKGKLSEGSLQLSADGELVANYLKLNDTAWFENEEIKVEIELEYLLEQNKIVIQFPLIETSAIRAEGKLTYDGENDLLISEVTSLPFSISSLIRTLPQQLSTNDFLRALDGSGEFRLNLRQQGEQHFLQIDLDLLNGEYSSRELYIPLSQMKGNFSLIQESTKPVVFSINDLSAVVEEEKIAVSGRLLDWGEKEMNFSVDGKVPLLPIYQLIGNETPEKWELASGFLTAKDFNWSSSNPGGENFRINELSGLLFPEKIILILAGEEFQLDGGRVNLEKDKKGMISLVNIEGNGSQFSLSAQTKDFSPLMEGKLEQELEIMIAAEQIQLDDWLAFFQKWNAQEEKELEEKGTTPEMKIQLATKELNYQGTQYQNLSSYLGIRDEGIIFNLEGNHAEGSLSADGYYSFGEIPFMSFRLNVLDMDLPAVFREWEDFNQDFILHNHLAGHLQGHISGKIFWDENGDYNKNHSEVIAAFEFHDGELNNFPMLQSFSTYLKAEELSNIRFDKVSNIIWMRDGTFYFPSMFIRSNAVNLTVSGAHTLDHEIRYGIRLNAAQTLGRRLVSRNPSFSPLPARERGFLNLHFLLTGSTDEVAYRNSTAEVTSLFRQTEGLRDRALAELLDTFGELPYFEVMEFREEIPEFHQEVEFEELEYLPGFEG